MSQDLIVVVATLTFYAVVVISPGPNFALISRLAVSGARSAAFGATFGLAIASTFYAILTMTGLAIVLTKVGWLASAIQIAGGVYLIFLGVTAWLSAKGSVGPVTGSLASRTIPRGVRMGMLVNFSNPKGIAFFLGFYAVAIPPGTALWAKLAILAGGFALEIVWYSLVTLLFSSRPARAAYERFGVWIGRAIGVALAGFGVRLISEKL